MHRREVPVIKRALLFGTVAVIAGVTTRTLLAQEPNVGTRIPFGAKVFIRPMNGFERFLAAAFAKIKVPIVVVGDREKAEFEISGWRTVFLGQTSSDQQLRINMLSIRNNAVVFTYIHNWQNSRRGRRSVAESCAKDLKDRIEHSKTD
jgi:hypothetical protein